MSNEAKFTKGLWQASCVKINGLEVKNGWGVEVEGFTLASVYTGSTFGVVHEQQKANAYLIAAAPEMYAMLDFISKNPSETNVNQIRNLLSKARGEYGIN